jgi:hypothetical protein
VCEGLIKQASVSAIQGGLGNHSVPKPSEEGNAIERKISFHGSKRDETKQITELGQPKIPQSFDGGNGSERGFDMALESSA